MGIQEEDLDEIRRKILSKPFSKRSDEETTLIREIERKRKIEEDKTKLEKYKINKANKYGKEKQKVQNTKNMMKRTKFREFDLIKDTFEKRLGYKLKIGEINTLRKVIGDKYIYDISIEEISTLCTHIQNLKTRYGSGKTIT
ncbi:hypothetical protein F1737_08825 [Methanoplanus sp. FWC-SCC4]|uniref:Uncharacterized protein n=1 Tax=Methanochimaera problematica TaxID=2609417 RepID=A0AA97I3J3_9EURY|nr:hypothetical protein [Methanoplanus sp. FWC-SCC4]WOF16783.1 hypothetical protein F1737_08825 [Methanoplanus sp. FWC-SCC4]